MEKVIKLDKSDLASRALAVSVRGEIAANIKASKSVVLDLENVMSISASYADELFGILTKKFGLDVVTDSLNIVNVSEVVLESIAEAIQIRSTESNLHAA